MVTAANRILAPQERYILAEIGTTTIVFPSIMVAEIVLIEQRQILPIPFYGPAFLGLVHSTSHTIPLLSLQQVLKLPPSSTLEKLTVIRLSARAGNLSGVGLVVDGTRGGSTREQLPMALFHSSQPEMLLFDPAMLGESLWRPRRWL